VLTHLLDEEIIPPSEVTDEITREKSSMTGEELLQLKRLEMEERHKERKAQYRMKELELREKELTFQVKLKELEAKVNRSIMGAIEAGAMVPFDASKHIKFVPDFHENKVDKYFLHFEKVAKSLRWPEDNWELLLQSSLVEKCILPCQLMKAVSMKLSRSQF